MSELLKTGSQGDEVKALQEKLKKVGFEVEPDGIFGAQTKAAVEDLQSAFGYTVDGIAGDGTKGLLDAQIGHGWSVKAPDGLKKALQSQGKTTDKGNLAGAELTRLLKKGVEGADVRHIQRRLQALGIGAPLTGVFDDGTEKAVRTLQSEFGYTVDGMVGPGTHTLIDAKLGQEWKAGGSGGAKAGAEKGAGGEKGAGPEKKG